MVTSPHLDNRVRVAVLGATGLLGSTIFRLLSKDPNLLISGTIRKKEAIKFFVPDLENQLVVIPDLTDFNALQQYFLKIQPQVVINCVSVGRPIPSNLENLIKILSVFPQRLAHICHLEGIRLIQISSDGVFSGLRGGYTEEDIPDAIDTYGIAKILGEVRETGAITLRTSILGPELETKTGILDWFLAQKKQCNGFTRSIFSGLPTIVLARLIRDEIIPSVELSGLFHIASSPISKFDLLRLIAKRYKKTIKIVQDDSVVVDRSLSAERFRAKTGYSAPDWVEMIDSMYSYNY
jgi:dTDP-4-dehydrorhamnose reductase